MPYINDIYQKIWSGEPVDGRVPVADRRSSRRFVVSPLGTLIPDSSPCLDQLGDAGNGTIRRSPCMPLSRPIDVE